MLKGRRRGTRLSSPVVVDEVVWLQQLVEAVETEVISTRRLSDGGIEWAPSRGAGTMVEGVDHVSDELAMLQWVVDASEVVEHAESNRE